MAEANRPDASERKELSDLILLQDRIIEALKGVKDQLAHPMAQDLMRAYARLDGDVETMSRVLASVESAIRDLKISEVEVRKALQEDSSVEEPRADGLPDLPAPLARFLAVRAESPGFEYEVLQDPDRGWIIRWKEFTSQGTVRGHGQFYERPYAWLED
jgi:hypothetical protein